MAKKKTHVSDFARNQLEKRGWTEGAGLGQSGQGITEAIKVNLKHDSHGVGHDSAKEFTNHWWNHVYDKAAAKIQVNHSEDGEVDVSKIEDDSENKEARSVNATSALYKNFVKSKTFLEDGKETTNKRKTSDTDSSYSDDEIEKEKKTRTDDDDLFRICGGRTAHKGARHGLKLSGKLARIAAQEEAQLSNSPLQSQHSNGRITTVESTVENNDANGTVEPTGKSKKKKKKKKKKSDKGQETDTQENDNTEISPAQENDNTEISPAQENDNTEISPAQENDNTEISPEVIQTVVTTEHELADNASPKNGDTDSNDLKKKKKKKKKKSDRKSDREDLENSHDEISQSGKTDKKRALDDKVPSQRKKQKTVDDVLNVKCEKPKKKRKE